MPVAQVGPAIAITAASAKALWVWWRISVSRWVAGASPRGSSKRRAAPGAIDQPVDQRVRLCAADPARGLHRLDVAFAAQQRYTERLTDRLARTLVVRVRVGQGVGRDRVFAHLPQDPALRVPRGSID